MNAGRMPDEEILARYGQLIWEWQTCLLTDPQMFADWVEEFTTGLNRVEKYRAANARRKCRSRSTNSKTKVELRTTA